MFSVNGRSFDHVICHVTTHVTRGIGVGLKTMKRYSIDRTQLIELSWVKSRVMKGAGCICV